jgi:hypothetical protein
LTQPSKPRKIIRVISGKNKDASRQADDSPAKKAKRPAPVVAEAYRYVRHHEYFRKCPDIVVQPSLVRSKSRIDRHSNRTSSQAVCSVAVELLRHTTSLQVVGCAMVISFFCKIKNYKSLVEDRVWCMEFIQRFTSLGHSDSTFSVRPTQLVLCTS